MLDANRLEKGKGFKLLHFQKLVMDSPRSDYLKCFEATLFHAIDCLHGIH